MTINPTSIQNPIIRSLTQQINQLEHLRSSLTKLSIEESLMLADAISNLENCRNSYTNR